MRAFRARLVRPGSPISTLANERRDPIVPALRDPRVVHVVSNHEARDPLGLQTLPFARKNPYEFETPWPVRSG